MGRALAVFIAAVCTVAPFLTGVADARQGAPSQASEEAQRRAEEQAEQEMQAIEKAEAEWRAETEQAFRETRQQRADFDKKMEDFADAHSKDAGTRVTYVMRIGDNGLPEGGEVWFVNRGFVTHRAEFDANGNTKGLFITPDGRARQNITAHRTPGVPASGRYLFTTGLDGRTQISDVVWQADDGTRGHLKFNLDGNAYFGEFWGTDGQRSGGFYDASLEPKEEPPPALWVPPVPRISTQPCEPCRAASDAYNEIVAKMQPIQREMADQARAIAKTSPGRARSAIVDRYNVLKAQWDAGAPALEAALAALKACVEACYKPANTTSLSSGQPGLPATPVPAAVSGTPAVTANANTTRMSASDISMSGEPMDRTFFSWSYQFGDLGLDDQVTRTVNPDGSVSYTVHKSGRDPWTYIVNTDGTVATQAPTSIPSAVAVVGNDSTKSISVQDLTLSGDPIDRTFASANYQYRGLFGPGDSITRTVNADGSVSYTVHKSAPVTYTVRADGTVSSQPGTTSVPTVSNAPATMLPPGYLKEFERTGGWSTLDENNPADKVLHDHIFGGLALPPAASIIRTPNPDGSVTYNVHEGGGSTVQYVVTRDGKLTTPSMLGQAATSVTLAGLQQSSDPRDLAFLNTAKNFVSGASPSTSFTRKVNPDGSVIYTGSGNVSYTVMANPAGGLNVRSPNGQVAPAVGGSGGLEEAAKVIGDAVSAAGPANAAAMSRTISPDGTVQEGGGTGANVSNACVGSACAQTTVPEVCTGPSCSSPGSTLDCDLPGCLPQTCAVGEMCTDLASYSSCQGCTQIGSGDRDERVQYMIIEIVIVRAAEHFRALPSIAQTARSLWDTLRGFMAGAPSFNASRRMGIEHPRPTFSHSARQLGASKFGATTLLTSLGTSMGEAFQIQVANDGRTPINLSGNGVIVEPLRQTAGQQARRAVSQLASRNPITQKLDAYCVEMLKQPPSLGTIFRVASPEIQKRFAPMRQVLQASYRLQQAGLLKPDSDPKAYFTSIKQWALWSRERNFNEKSYGDAFVEHTKKAAGERGMKWTSQIESGIRALVPSRWADISQILAAAR